MLHYFPEPRPEELFLSIIARYGEHLRLWRRHQVQNQLFGRGNIIIGIELPRALQALVDRLPVHCHLGVDDFINKHTVLRLYLPFITPSLRDDAAQAMRGDEVRDVTAILGRNGKMQLPDYLRFCPMCLKQDEQTFGEAYWHRSHQVPGVEVCAKHLIFLEASNASRNAPLSRYALNTARASCPDVQPRTIDTFNKNHGSLLDIANDVDWLLEKNDFLPDPHLIQNRYIDLLIENGFAVCVNKIHYEHLREAIRDRFSDVMLQKLDCPVSENGKYLWIKRFIHQDVNVLRQPLHYLVLIRSLGFSIESFFNLLRETPTRFGRGPWPCDNPVCPEHRRCVIEYCKVQYNNRDKECEGIFCCPRCGYTYSGIGILDSGVNPFMIKRCHDRGDLWNERLKLLWSDKNNTIWRIGRALGVSVNVLVRQVVQQDLPLRKCDENNGSFALFNAARSRVQAHVRLIQAKRELWLKLCEEYPEASLKQLEHLQNSPAVWLMANDRSWLLENRPAIRRRGRTKGDANVHEDWASRDQEYSLQVNQAASAIKSQPGRPIRVSISAICRTISTNNARSSASRYNPNNSEDAVCYVRPLGVVHVTKKYVTKNLPLTESALRQVLESPLEFARRRLLWAADECRKETRTFTRYRLAVVAGVRTLSDKDHKRPESIALCALMDELCCGVAQSQLACMDTQRI